MADWKQDFYKGIAEKVAAGEQVDPKRIELGQMYAEKLEWRDNRNRDLASGRAKFDIVDVFLDTPEQLLEHCKDKLGIRD